jgi:tRNA pseudouridine13 synthase
VHAYQSRLWNEVVKDCLDIGFEGKVPIIGFGIDIKDEKLKKIINEKLEKEQITFRDFIIKQIPELSSEGSEREMFVEVKDFKVLEKGDGRVKVSFFLPKGSYATVAIDEIFK